MIETIVAGVVVILSALATWYMNRKRAVVDGKVAKALEMANNAMRADFRLRNHLVNGDHEKLSDDLDKLSSDLRALRWMLKDPPKAPKT